MPRFTQTTSAIKVKELLGDLLPAFYQAACCSHGCWRNFGQNLTNERYFAFLWRWVVMMDVTDPRRAVSHTQQYFKSGFLPPPKKSKRDGDDPDPQPRPFHDIDIIRAWEEDHPDSFAVEFNALQKDADMRMQLTHGFSFPDSPEHFEVMGGANAD